MSKRELQQQIAADAWTALLHKCSLELCDGIFAEAENATVRQKRYAIDIIEAAKEWFKDLEPEPLEAVEN